MRLTREEMIKNIINEVHSYRIKSIANKEDVPDYETYGKMIDAFKGVLEREPIEKLEKLYNENYKKD